MKRQNSGRPALQKEKISIIAASVFVLSALTLTGVYMSAQGDEEKNENMIDFAKLEQQGAEDTDLTDSRFVSGKAQSELASQNTQQADDRFTNTELYNLSDNNDMDVDPAFTEANSGQVENTKQENSLAGTDKAAVFMDDGQDQEITALTFSASDTLALPVVGDVLVDFSMDKAIYHETMNQYYYSPALVIAATEGQTVTAAADGIVTEVYYDSKTGNSISFDLGNGYELTYGQLEGIELSKGDRVTTGDVVGTVAKPTIYYAEEGTNIYYKLTKDGAAIDPLMRVQESE